ncbi:uncharacterized protein SCHCODRAFT_0109499 [Schizophyllum commune H4-8]
MQNELYEQRHNARQTPLYPFATPSATPRAASLSAGYSRLAAYKRQGRNPFQSAICLFLSSLPPLLSSLPRLFTCPPPVTTHLIMYFLAPDRHYQHHFLPTLMSRRRRHAGRRRQVISPFVDHGDCQRRKADDGQHVSVQLLAATDVELKLTTNTKLTHAGTSALFPLRPSASCVLGLTTAVHDEQEHRAPANNPRPFSPDTARHPHPIIFDDSYAAPRFMNVSFRHHYGVYAKDAVLADDRTDAGVPNTTHESAENAVKSMRSSTTHARSTPKADPSITKTHFSAYAEPPEACVRFLGEERDEGWTPPVRCHAKRNTAEYVAALNVCRHFCEIPNRRRHAWALLVNDATSAPEGYAQVFSANPEPPEACARSLGEERDEGRILLCHEPKPPEAHALVSSADALEESWWRAGRTVRLRSHTDVAHWDHR